MEIEKIQNEINEIIDKIDKKTNCEHNLNNTFIHLIEEIGEVANILNKPNIRGENIRKEDLSEELADVLLLTTRIASLHNIKIEEAITNKIIKLKQRHNLSN